MRPNKAIDVRLTSEARFVTLLEVPEALLSEPHRLAEYCQQKANTAGSHTSLIANVAGRQEGIVYVPAASVVTIEHEGTTVWKR